MIPHQYRTVAFTDVDIELEEAGLRALLLSRQVYRRTRFVVARHDGQTAILEVTKADDKDLFCDVIDVQMLAGPDETILVERPDIDTAVPSQLARVAAELGQVKRGVVVRGRYEHVNFVLDSDVRRVHVLDVAPPHPAKLYDQVARLLDTAEDLPPTECVPQVVDLEELAATVPSDHYLLPCRGGGITVGDAGISYLDEVPPPADWVLLGCARSRAIHDHFYPDIAPHLQQIDICPAALARSLPLPPGEARLTKCCLLEEHIETRGDTVVVPWGASFSLVSQGLATASELAGELQTDADGTP
ncbi:MAG: hypothetical protein JWQ91_2546 [Aeromicrobium sp.]|uniref:DUF7714 family protein n=1 Tax=Aeromicrobium sp. TaxID=1871063 RepID=UPI00262E3D61|nr:hypothetical protein [Aeromicrobium sp.]MCW2788675.1 hypothetical protein [Aeromicrobium sp.]MCW2825629.1 hypothetical protein [Aeromicrobium sp.]